MDRLEFLRPYYAHLAALGVAIALGLTVAAFKLASDPPAVDTADRWPLPQWAPYRAGPLRDALARTPIWAEDPTKAKVVVEKKPEGPPWRFIGTLQEGKVRLAVIELDQGKRIQRVAAGQPLPNGAVITKIDTTTLTYDEGGVEKALRLFGAAKTDNLAAGTGKN
ncbi:MAG: hypothetical protein AB7P20_17760 [Rhizobiaceae bacterium]